MEPYLGEIRCFGFGLIPQGWLACSGQSLSVAQNQALYSLIGTAFGGNQTAFNLPNLNGVVPTGILSNGAVGVSGGAETITLDPKFTDTAAHTHLIAASTVEADEKSPAGYYLAATAAPHLSYGSINASPVAMAAGIVGTAGGGQPHPNMQPFLALNFCIAASGLYPMRP